MRERVKITAVVGTYRKGGMIDQAVDEILEAARAEGAAVSRIHLLDKDIRFCANCRNCTQAPSEARGRCAIADDMPGILDELEQSDAIVLACPMNFWSVTAIMKRFIERLICFAYWPWGMNAPKVRRKKKTKRAVLVTSSASPAFVARLITRMVGLLKSAAGLLGAKTVGVLCIGLAAGKERPELARRNKEKARAFGKKLASGGPSV